MLNMMEDVYCYSPNKTKYFIFINNNNIISNNNNNNNKIINLLGKASREGIHSSLHVVGSSCGLY